MHQPCNILVVDDDPDIGLMLQMMLEFKGYQVSLLNRAENARHIIAEREIALVILDMLIAGTYGTDVCSDIRQDIAYATLPILMISALPDARQVCLDAGATDFISKPFEMNHLLNKIESLLHAAV